MVGRPPALRTAFRVGPDPSRPEMTVASINSRNRIGMTDSNFALDGRESRTEDSAWRTFPKATLPPCTYPRTHRRHPERCALLRPLDRAYAVRKAYVDPALGPHRLRGTRTPSVLRGRGRGARANGAGDVAEERPGSPCPPRPRSPLRQRGFPLGVRFDVRRHIALAPRHRGRLGSRCVDAKSIRCLGALGPGAQHDRVA
jgi:hypothetical protein